MSDSMEEFENAVTEVTDDDIKEVGKLAKMQVELETKIESVNAQLAELQAQHKKLTEEVLPEAMMELGVTQLRLVDGSMIAIKEEIYASISKKNQQTAHTWLREHGHSSLIKHEFKTTFGRDEDELAAKFKAFLDKTEFKYQDSETVHWQTLRAFCREQIREGRNLPVDLFGVHIVNKSIIERKD